MPAAAPLPLTAPPASSVLTSVLSRGGGELQLRELRLSPRAVQMAAELVNKKASAHSTAPLRVLNLAVRVALALAEDPSYPKLFGTLHSLPRVSLAADPNSNAGMPSQAVAMGGQVIISDLRLLHGLD